MPFPGANRHTRCPSRGTIKISEFNSKWIRQITVKVVGAAPEVIDQQITYMDPYFIRIIPRRHGCGVRLPHVEWDPKLVRKLLIDAPGTPEPDGKCDPLNA